MLLLLLLLLQQQQQQQQMTTTLTMSMKRQKDPKMPTVAERDCLHYQHLHQPVPRLAQHRCRW